MSCSSVSSEPPKLELHPVVVNGFKIDQSEIAQEVQNHPADNINDAVSDATKALVIKCLLKQKADELGMKSDDEEQMISDLLNEQAYAPEATEDECHRYFMANTEQFHTSPLVEVSHILLAAAPEDLKKRMELKQTALELIAQLKGDESKFAEFAGLYSSCPSKEVAGSLGQLSRGQTVPEFEKIVFVLDQGVADYPVESRYGFHVVQVHRRIDGKPLEYEMNADRIRQYLNERAQRKAISQYIQVLISESDIEGFDPLQDVSPLMQ